MTSKIDWPAIFAGAVLATASGLILITFGAALGLSAASPYADSGASPQVFVFLAGLWMLWVQVLSFSIGGYVTARLRARATDETEHEADVRDGLHGLTVWGVGVIAAALIALAGLGSGAAASRAANTQDAVASAGAVAEQRVDEAASAEARDNPKAADASQAEREAAIARKLSIIAAFITAASMLAGAVAAFWAAGQGGDHRDKNVTIRFFVLRPPANTIKP